RTLLVQQGFPDPERILHSYPHQLSGGMKQRALLAMLLAGRPRLMIADEPTKGLDPENRAEALVNLARTREVSGAAMLLVTHDLVAALRLGDRIAILHGGKLSAIHTPRESLAAAPDPWHHAVE